jgi:hypothetical protein
VGYYWSVNGLIVFINVFSLKPGCIERMAGEAVYAQRCNGVFMLGKHRRNHAKESTLFQGGFYYAARNSEMV